MDKSPSVSASARIAGWLGKPIVIWPVSFLLLPLLNAGLNRLILKTGLPLFLDSIFTVFAAAAFGVWPGIATAVMTNFIVEVIDGFPGVDLPFAVCGIATAVIVARAVKKDRARGSLYIALLIVEVSLANAILGAMIAVFVFGGYTGVNIDVIVSGLNAALGNILSAAFLARIPMNLVDKGIAVIAALFFLKAILPKQRTEPERL